MTPPAAGNSDFTFFGPIYQKNDISITHINPPSWFCESYSYTYSYSAFNYMMSFFDNEYEYESHNPLIW